MGAVIVRRVRGHTATSGGEIRSRARKGYIGLFVGARYVPMQAFAAHQELRGHDVMIGAGEALPVTDVLESAPIFVAFAPEPLSNTDTFVDPFTLPEFASVARTSASGTVIFVRP